MIEILLCGVTSIVEHLPSVPRPSRAGDSSLAESRQMVAKKLKRMRASHRASLALLARVSRVSRSLEIRTITLRDRLAVE